MGSQKKHINDTALLSIKNTIMFKIITILRSNSKNYFSYFSTKTHAVGTQKNCPDGSFERLKHMFKMMGKKVITILHSNSENIFLNSQPKHMLWVLNETVLLSTQNTCKNDVAKKKNSS